MVIRDELKTCNTNHIFEYTQLHGQNRTVSYSEYLYVSKYLSHRSDPLNVRFFRNFYEVNLIKQVVKNCEKVLLKFKELLLAKFTLHSVSYTLYGIHMEIV